MNFSSLFRAAAISSSGLTAERIRLEVTANNIANAFSTRTAEGGPFRRQDVVFVTALADEMGLTPRLGAEMAGVRATEIVDDPSPFNVVHMPGHPDADAQGYVRFPNVQLPMEMVNLVTASRAYEANVRAGLAFREMSQQALTLARS
jgi:flagellar basal-body rod protein FlgC